MTPTKKTLVFLSVGLVLLVSYVAAGPFIAIHRIKSAIVQRDPEALASNVAFPELRENLKEQFNALFLKKASTELQGNPFAGLGMLFASKMVDTLVDSSVTPSGLAALMSGKSPVQSADSQSSDSRLLPNARYTYDSISKFSAWVQAEDGKELRLVFTRYDLSWKLSNILLPVDVFSGAQAADSAAAPPGSVSANASVPAADSASTCLEIRTFDSSVLSRNDVFTEVAWKADLQNTCSRDFKAKVKFVLYDKDDFELDTDSQTIVVPASGIGKARGKMLVSPPDKAARMAKQGASFSAY